MTGVFSGNASDDYIKVLSHPDTVNGGHRHQEGYYNSLGVLQNKWFAESDWSEGDNDYYGRCPTRQSARRTSTTIVPSSPSPVLYGRASYTEPIEVEPECVEQITQHFLWQGETLFGLRLLPEGVETLADFWDAYEFSVDKGNKIWTYFGGWNAYDAGEHWGMATLPISANMGFVIDQNHSTLINIEGCPLENEERVWLFPGINIVGFPEPPELFERPSDFLSETILSVKVQVGTPYGALYHTIEAPGDKGDTPIKAGQAVILNSTEHQWLNLSTPISAAPQAPMAQRVGTLATSWGAMKR